MGVISVSRVFERESLGFCERRFEEFEPIRVRNEINLVPKLDLVNPSKRLVQIVFDRPVDQALLFDLQFASHHNLL